ncbi:MAG: hypothetical protein JJU29_18525 [Verrucomicrobia bacterium]|nr:hypothetical protein [Verrucomicrobiota bacterium]MCH8512408.1 polymer-forming cytoskeletal protein [Kiritimatiellia bacterium]
MKNIFYILGVLIPGMMLQAVVIVGYDPEVHDRFESGYPTAPVENASENFIGKGYDWSGVGWSVNDTRRNVAFLSPRHYLMARHFMLANGSNVRILGANGVVDERTQQARKALGLGALVPINEEGDTMEDLAIGWLSSPFSAAEMPVRYGVLDLNPSSTSSNTGPYVGLPLLMMGRGNTNPVTSPRIGETPITQATASGTQHDLRTSRDVVQLQGGDSGSPSFSPWTNPNGGQELTLLGNHAAISSTQNIDNFIGSHQVMNALNAEMRPDGFALRVVGNPGHTWTGEDNSNINRNRNWGIGGNPNATGGTSDRYVQFNGDSANIRNISVNANYNLRGLYFLPATAGGFTFSNTNTLTLGRGGITNYDDHAQVFSAPLRLGADQHWMPGPGGLVIQNLDTNGFLLELHDPGTLTINGTVSGSGHLAVSRGLLQLAGNSTYTGETWVHHGTLRVDGDISSSPNVRLGSGGVLTGNGRVANLRGDGRVEKTDGILTAQTLHTEDGMDFSFTFGGEAFADNAALRLTAAVPFSASFSTNTAIDIILDVESLADGQVYHGGFFTDASDDFLTTLGNANLTVYMPDPNGSGFLPLNADWDVTVGTESLGHDFGNGLVQGRVLRLELHAVTGDGETYDDWADAVFPQGTPEEDKEPFAAPNDVGLINLLSYFHRLDPLDPDMSQRPQTVADDADFVIRFRRNTHADDLSFEVQFSGDLQQWGPSGLVAHVIDPDPDGDGNSQLLEARLPYDQAPANTFLRIFVSYAQEETP